MVNKFVHSWMQMSESLASDVGGLSGCGLKGGHLGQVIGTLLVRRVWPRRIGCL